MQKIPLFAWKEYIFVFLYRIAAPQLLIIEIPRVIDNLSGKSGKLKF